MTVKCNLCGQDSPAEQYKCGCGRYVDNDKDALPSGDDFHWYHLQCAVEELGENSVAEMLYAALNAAELLVRIYRK